MILLLISFIYTFISTVNSQIPQAICIWGRSTTNLPGREINGLYRLATEQANGAPYWKLDMTGTDCPSAYFWLFWYGDSSPGWYIGTSSTASFAFDMNGLLSAKCTNSAADDTQGPHMCGNNWAYFSDYSTTIWDTIDSAITATAGPCPLLNCAEIAVSHSATGGCTGTFLQTGDNHYTETGSGDIWWFNVPQFQWQCNTGAANAEQTCDYSNTGKLSTALVQEIDVQTWKGETGTMVYTGGQCACYAGTRDITFTCQGGSGTSTSFKNGTYAPTTPNPTRAPAPTPRPTTITYSPSTETTSAPSTMTYAPSAVTYSPTAITYAPTAGSASSTNGPTQFSSLSPTSDVFTGFDGCIKIDIFDGLGELIIDIDITNELITISITGPKDKWFGIGFGNTKMLNTYAYIVSESSFDITERKLGNHQGGNEEQLTSNAISKSTIGNRRYVAFIRGYKSVGRYDFTEFIECNEKLNIIWALGADLNFGLHLQKGTVSISSCLCPTTTTSMPTEREPTDKSNVNKMKVLRSFIVAFMVSVSIK